ncbi:hypothetical protein MTR67_021811 [Solanum verrucosum]|uniref:F-box associated beta-propeller type 3 domain-containing protein n=1 Tax=Solanum verrucosum TaxID=315347 RepID=A0AAF0QS67_SOLVR|nr:hypothetical protein MTR67_021811 [Solanum verrucosum]
MLNKERSTELFDIGSPMENPSIYTWIVSSVNGLICLYSKIEEIVLWNPSVKKSKKLPTLGAKLRNGCSYYLKYGFGYDVTRDDYKVVSNMRIVVNIYSLRTDSWTTLHDQLHGIFIINHSDETWGCLELSVSGEDNSNIKLGVVGSAFCALFLPSRYYYF